MDIDGLDASTPARIKPPARVCRIHQWHANLSKHSRNGGTRSLSMIVTVFCHIGDHLWHCIIATMNGALVLFHLLTAPPFPFFQFAAQLQWITKSPDLPAGQYTIQLQSRRESGATQCVHGWPVGAGTHA